MDSLSISKEYARALFLLTEETERSDTVYQDSLTVREAISENPDYLAILDSPALPLETRLGSIDEAFGRLDEYLVNLIKMIVERRLTHSLLRVLSSYEEEYHASRGIITAEAVTCIPLTEGECDALRAKLERITSKRVIIKNRIDESILGGIKLRYMGVQLDDSVKTRLDEMRHILKGSAK